MNAGGFEQSNADEYHPGMLLLIGTGVLWGTIGVASKGVFEHSALDAVSVTWIRTLMASPICILAVWLSGGRKLLTFSQRDLLGMIALGIALISLSMVVSGRGRADRGHGHDVDLAVRRAGDRGDSVGGRAAREAESSRNWWRWCGALIGTGLADRAADRDGGRQWRAGGALCAGCALGIAVHAMGSRRVAGRVHPLVVLSIGFSVGAIALAPLVFARGLHPHADPTAWALLVYLATVPSFVAYFFYQRGLRDVPASMATIVTLLEPMVAAVLAWFFFDERLGWNGLCRRRAVAGLDLDSFDPGDEA